MKWGNDGDKWGKTGSILWVNGGAAMYWLMCGYHHVLIVDGGGELWIKRPFLWKTMVSCG